MGTTHLNTLSGDVPADVARARGSTLGRYILLDRLGAGGMGVVYAAYDPELDRKVAVKILREVSAERQARLTREAQAMARLSHPNVIAVHDVGVDGGAVFVAMELVDGQTLSAWRAATPRSWRDIVEVFVRAGEGLAAAHRAGIVHRDFKPDNVMIRDDDDRVLVSDFGLARLATEPTDPADGAAAPAPEASPPARDLTHAGALLGTPAYMSPEQHRGEAATARSDQFAFCVALYEALYDERPFRADAAGGHGLDTVDALALEIVKGNVRPAPRQTTVPGWLRRLVVRGLARGADERWPTMDALLAALRHDPRRALRRWLVAGGAVAVAAIVGLGALSRADDRAPVCAGAPARVAAVWDARVKAAGAAAFAATGKPYAADAWKRTERLLDGYADRWAALHTATCEATEVRHEQSPQLLDLKMSCLDRRLAALAALATIFTDHVDDALLGRAITAAGALPPLASCEDTAALTALVPLPDAPTARHDIDELGVQIAKVQALDAAGKLKEALAADQPVIERARAVGYPVTLADALFQRAHVLQTMRNIKDGEPAIRDAIVASGEAHEDGNTAMMIASLEYVMHIDGHNAEALALVPAAEAALRRAGNPPQSVVAVELTRAQLLEANGKSDEAEQVLRAAIPIQEQLGPTAAELGVMLLTLANLDREQNKVADARVAIDRAIALLIARVGEQHPAVATAYNARANIEMVAGDLDAAGSDYRHARQIGEAALGSDNEVVAEAMGNVAMVDASRGRLADAEAGYLGAIAMWVRLSGPDHPTIARVDNNLAMLLIDEGKYDQAIETATRGMALRTKLKAPATLNARGSELIGYALIGLGRFAEAKDAFASAVAVEVAGFAADNPQLAEDRIGLGEALVGLHQPAAALALFAQAIPVLDAQDPANSRRASGRFLRAEALLAQGDAAGARTAAADARATFAKLPYLSPGDQGRLAAVTAWLAAHP